MKIRKLLPIIGLALFVYLVYRIGIAKIIHSFSNLNPWYLILSFALIPIYLLVFTYKWSLILKKQGIHLRLWYLTKLYLIGNFYGTITPARAGSLIRAYYLKNKINRPFGACASSIVLERVMDLSVIFITAILGGLLLLHYFSAQILLEVIIAFILFFGAFLFFLSKKRSEFIFKIFYSFFIPARFKSRVMDSFNSFYSNIPKLTKLIAPFLFTFVNWMIIFLASFIIAKALSIKVPLHYFIPLYALATIVSIIPITISGLGTRELALISLFSIFGVLPEKVIAMSLLSVIFGLIPALLGFIISLKEKIKGDEIFTDTSGSTG